MAWVRTWFSRLSKVGICEDGLPKTPKIIQHSVSPIQFCQTTFGRGLFRGKGIRVLSHSKECHMGKHLAKDASLEWIKLAKPQISKWCRYDILINQSLASHELANTGTSNLKSHWISKHWDEKVASVCCPRSCPEMTLQYNHRNIFASTDISMIQFWTSFRGFYEYFVWICRENIGSVQPYTTKDEKHWLWGLSQCTDTEPAKTLCIVANTLPGEYAVPWYVNFGAHLIPVDHGFQYHPCYQEYILLQYNENVQKNVWT